MTATPNCRSPTQAPLPPGPGPNLQRPQIHPVASDACSSPRGRWSELYHPRAMPSRPREGKRQLSASKGSGYITANQPRETPGQGLLLQCLLRSWGLWLLPGPLGQWCRARRCARGGAGQERGPCSASAPGGEPSPRLRGPGRAGGCDQSRATGRAVGTQEPLRPCSEGPSPGSSSRAPRALTPRWLSV